MQGSYCIVFELYISNIIYYIFTIENIHEIIQMFIFYIALNIQLKGKKKVKQYFLSLSKLM